MFIQSNAIVVNRKTTENSPKQHEFRIKYEWKKLNNNNIALIQQKYPTIWIVKFKITHSRGWRASARALTATRRSISIAIRFVRQVWNNRESERAQKIEKNEKANQRIHIYVYDYERHKMLFMWKWRMANEHGAREQKKRNTFLFCH